MAPHKTLYGVLLVVLFSAMSVDAGQWCVATTNAPTSNLQDNINYACSRIDCKPIQPGGPCFEPNTLNNHASFAMNSYYQVNGQHPWDCDFKGTGTIAVTDPSYGNCKYLGD